MELVYFFPLVPKIDETISLIISPSPYSTFCFCWTFLEKCKQHSIAATWKFKLVVLEKNETRRTCPSMTSAEFLSLSTTGVWGCMLPNHRGRLVIMECLASSLALHTRCLLDMDVCVCSVESYSWQPHGLYSTRFLCPWDSPGENTGVGCHTLLQGIFPTKWLNSSLPHCRQILDHWAAG